MERDRIDQLDLISPFGQPDRVSAWAAAYVCHDGWRGREVPFDKNLGPHVFERAGPVGETVAFEPPSVAGEDFVIA